MDFEVADNRTPKEYADNSEDDISPPDIKRAGLYLEEEDSQEEVFDQL